MNIRNGLLALIAAIGLAACQSPAAPAPDETAIGRAAWTGEACGGFVGIACKVNGDFCKMPTGTCQVADGMGVCVAQTPMCTREYKPVCGCDGKTYGNACTAAAAGVSLDREGACPP